jgi:hypothetical protein
MRSAAALLVLLLAAAAFAADAWQEVRSKEGGFVALFPKKPKITTEPGDANAAPAHVFTADLGETAYVVSYTDYPKGAFVGRDAQTILDRARNDLVKDRPVELLVDRKIAMDKFEGREIVFQDKDGYTQAFRLYIAGDRLYEIIAGGPGRPDLSVEGKHFFDAFRLEQH